MPTLARLREQLRPSAVHPAVLPALLVVLMLAELASVRPPALPVAVAGAFVTCTALALRRRQPLVPVLVVPTVLALEGVLGVSTKDTSTPVLPVFWVVFLLFAELTGRRQAVGLTVVVGAICVAMLVDGGRVDVGNLTHSLLFTLALCLPAAITGGYVRTRHRQVALVEERAALMADKALLLEREQDLRAESALVHERLRIARELHDIVAHSVGLMGIQAAAVRRLLTPEQEQLRETLLSVERTGREAITELQHVLGVLRDGQPAATAPQPGLAELPELVAAARAAGQQVALSCEGLPDVPAGVALTTYRLVQEALSNARKHAPDAAVDVAVTADDAATTVVVSNPLCATTVPPSTSPVAAGRRFGLRGMSERVTALGGSLDAGRAHDCFVVRARLPHREADEVDLASVAGSA